MKTLFSLLFLLFSFVANAGVLDDLRSNGTLQYYTDFRSGHSIDLSGNGWALTNTTTPWSHDGLEFDGNACGVFIGDVDLVDALSIFILQAPRSFDHSGGGAFPRIIEKSGSYQLRQSGDGRVFVTLTGLADTGGVSAGYVALSTQTVMGVTWSSASSIIRIYIDGKLDTVDSGATGTITQNASNVTIGGFPTRCVNAAFSAVVIVAAELSETQVAQLSAELQDRQWPRLVTSMALGSYGPEVINNGDFEIGDPPTGWSAINGAALSSQPGNVLYGDQFLRVTYTGSNQPYARQFSILTIGKRYRFSGWARGDGGTVYPQVYLGISSFVWKGNTSTSWQRFDLVDTASTTDIGLMAVAIGAGWADFDNVSITEVHADETQWKTDWATPADNVNRTDGFVGPFEIFTGTHKMITDIINNSTIKALECVAPGIVYVPSNVFKVSPHLAARGTYEFYWRKGADANALGITFIADTIGIMGAAGQDGYDIRITTSEALALREATSGSAANLFTTSASYVNNLQWYKTNTTISEPGVFTVYLDDVLVNPAGGSGTNPVSDTTTTTSDYWLFDLDVGDRISYSSVSGNYSVSKKHGVITP